MDKSNGCNYCYGKLEIIENRSNRKYRIVICSDGATMFCVSSGNKEYFDMDYCPKCGRRLEGLNGQNNS